MSNRSNLNDPKVYKKAKIFSIIGKILGAFFTVVPIISLIVIIAKQIYDTDLGAILMVIFIIACVYVVPFGIRLFSLSKINSDRDIVAYVKSPRFKLTIAGLVMIAFASLGIMGAASGGNDAVPFGVACLVIMFVGIVLLRRRLVYCEWCGTKMIKGELRDREVEYGDFEFTNDYSKLTATQTTKETYRYHCPNCGYWREIIHTSKKKV